MRTVRWICPAVVRTDAHHRRPGCALREVRARRVRIEGLAEADGFQLAQDIGDGFTALHLGEDLRDEGNDRVGDAFRRARPGLRLGLVRPIMSGCSALWLGDDDQPKVIDAVEVLCLDFDG
ncbi:hypothetical protein [Streptomyces sp. Wb2n-11]|uniref:hypothetical protein n=1 Tax=Streptomyces sp. Wb2n-11 TaxID=1030533 RepID=UPI000B33AB6F|nr:hypothetical protein [Streptomyces sp. Wb2n-11]